MKNILAVLFSFALCGGSLFAQETPAPTVNSFTCEVWSVVPELQRTLALTPDQCARIETVSTEVWFEMNVPVMKLNKVNNTLNDLVWNQGGTGMSENEFVQKVSTAKREKDELEKQLKDLREKLSRQVLGVLDARQRGVIDGLTAVAKTVQLFNQANLAGLIPQSITDWVNGSNRGFTTLRQQRQ